MLIGWMCIGCALREESDRGNSRDIFEKIQNSCSLVTARTQGLRTKLSAERNFIPSLLVQQSPYAQAVGRRPQVGKPGAPQTPKGRTTETSTTVVIFV
jgi:hypothetical protein